MRGLFISAISPATSNEQAETSTSLCHMTIESKSDLTSMRTVGRLVALALREMREAVRPGMTTQQLDDIGAAFMRKRGARSAPQLTYGFPGFNCISVNDEVVHGIPGP